MYLEDILGSKTKVRILSVLFTKEEDSFFEKELAQTCGASVSEVNRQIGALVEFGLIHYTKQGRLKMYRLNRAHFLYQPLRQLFTLAV
jgi:DNA-binding transcriptional ArsR family regulator